MGSLSDTKQTFFYERWRAVSSGVLETAATMFLLLIAVRWFEAGTTAKAFVASASSFGLMLTPLVVSTVARVRIRSAQAASLLAAAGSLSFLVMAAIPSLPVFVIGSVIGLTSISSAVPLFTQIYQENYPAKRRGHLFSRTVMLRITTAALFSEFAGRALTNDMGSFRTLLFLFSGASALASFCLARIPSTVLSDSGGSHPFRSLRYAGEDVVFRRVLISWMIMGFANLMMLPMRVEYLANPKYGLSLSPGEIAFLVGVVPYSARLALNPVWGRLFDRMNFFVLRATLNIGFVLGIGSFFASSSVTGLILGAIAFGASNSGSDVAWSLWVTKFAPPSRVAEYMSVHTFFTGVRGFIAPLVAFHLVEWLPLKILSYIAIGLILASIALLLPEIRFGRSGRKATPLVEEIPE